MPEAPSARAALSAELVGLLREAGESVACAESLTAGLLAAAVADTPGASDVLRGGVVAYAAELKTSLLGVPAALLAEAGTVDPRVAAAMAEGVRERLGATWGLATTGVAGPGPSEGKPAGTVHVAVAGPSGTATHDLRLNGSRAQVRDATVERLLSVAADAVRATHRSAAPEHDPRGTVGTNGPTAGPEHPPTDRAPHGAPTHAAPPATEGGLDDPLAT